MRKLFLDLHLFAGVLCAPVLVVYGLSTLSFNHEWVRIQPGVSSTTWIADATPQSGLTTRETARARPETPSD